MKLIGIEIKLKLLRQKQMFISHFLCWMMLETLFSNKGMIKCNVLMGQRMTIKT